jgi:hypothetical protein
MLAYKQLLCCTLLLVYSAIMHAQTDSTNRVSPNGPVKMDTLSLSDQETRDMQKAVSNPGWYVVSLIAQYFNVGVNYSYLMPAGTFRKQVSSTSAFSFDFGLDLTHMFVKRETNMHVIIGLNADYANFGKTKDPYKKVNGDTTFEVSIKSTLDVYSYYVEAEYRKSFLAPFVSVAYSQLLMGPYKREKKTIHNSSVNSTTTVGEGLAQTQSSGVNITAGLKCKYRFNDHKELMLVSRVSYLRSAAIEMMDLSSLNFLPGGDFTYQTITAHPSWFMVSVGVKYNF